MNSSKPDHFRLNTLMQVRESVGLERDANFIPPSIQIPFRYLYKIESNSNRRFSASLKKKYSGDKLQDLYRKSQEFFTRVGLK